MEFADISEEEKRQVHKQSKSCKSEILLNSFLEADVEIALVTLSEQEKKLKPNSVRSTIQNYISKHGYPVRVFSRQGNIYLENLNLKESDPTDDDPNF